MNTGKYGNRQKAEEFVRRVMSDKADYYDDLSHLEPIGKQEVSV